jgi:dephospho-CoA kinase
MRIIALTGLSGSGKGVTVDYLQNKYGFIHFSAREYLLQEIEKRGLPKDRQTMINLADELRATHGSDFFAKQLYKQSKEQGKDAVIESIRSQKEGEAIKEIADCELWAVTAPIETRYERIKKRKLSTDMVDFETFKSQEEQETLSGDPNKGNILKCIQIADVTLDNSQNLDYLYKQIDKYIAPGY